MARNPEYQHLAKSVLLEETGTTFIARSLIWFSIIVIGAFGAWAWFTVIKEVAVTHGEIVPTGKVQKIQHLEGGRIAAILVDDGAIVEAGQVVVRLDNLTARTALAKTEPELATLEARKARLNAFTRGNKPDFSALRDGGKGTAAAYQTRILEQALLSMQANRDTIISQIGALEANVAELASRSSSLKKQAALLNEELTMRTTLFEKGLTSRSVILALQRQKSELDGERKGLPSRRAGIKKQIAEAEARLQALDSDLVGDVLQELSEIETDISKLTEERKTLIQRLELTDIRAPTAGIAHGLNEHSVGAILEPGQTIVEIVPIEGALVAEVRIEPKDIGYIRVGQEVALKFTAYEFSRFGSMTGTLKNTSATTFRDENGIPYYKGIVPLKSGLLKVGGNSYPILPGMTLDADILTGEKTVFEYLLKPIYQSAGSALREK